MFAITITTHHHVYIEATSCVYSGYHMCIYRVPHVCIQGAKCVYTRYHMNKQCSIWISSGTVGLMVFFVNIELWISPDCKRAEYWLQLRFFCTFSFGLCVVCSSSIYRFWLPLWYLQTLRHTSVNIKSSERCQWTYLKKLLKCNGRIRKSRP
jgi:hypothetical protein